MIKIAIIDDDKMMLELICNKINSYIQNDDLEITRFLTGEAFVECMNQGDKWNIILCDIELDGMSGMEIGKIIRKSYPEAYLIYVTSHSEFALEGYKLDAYQYVMKDELDTRFPQIMLEVVDKIKRDSKNHKIIIGNSDKSVLNYEDVVCIVKEKSAKYIRYKTKYASYRERKTLDTVIKELDSNEFLLVERGVIVNIKHILRLKGNILYLDNNDEIVVSGARVGKVKKEISDYWGTR